MEDLGFSPDVEAYICYLTLIVVSGISAAVNIYQMLGSIPRRGIWTIGRTWFLFGLYILIPVALFWLLDRTSAISDTSLLSAILVGFSYDQIMRNQITSISVATKVSTLLKPLQTWAEEAAKRVRLRLKNNDALAKEKLFTVLEKDNKKFEVFAQLVYSKTDRKLKLGEKLDEIANSPPSLSVFANKPPADFNLYRYAQIQILYDELRLSKPDTFEYFLKKEKIIGKERYWWKKHGGKVVAGLFIVLFVGILAGGYFLFNIQGVSTTYYRWRLYKPNTTAVDQHRALSYFSAWIDTTKTPQKALDNLHHALSSPQIALVSIERILFLVRTKRDTLSQQQEVDFLLKALSIERPEVRSRVHETMEFLAGQWGYEVDPGLHDALPDASASLLKVEEFITDWEKFWKSPTKKPAPPDSTTGS